MWKYEITLASQRKLNAGPVGILGAPSAHGPALPQDQQQAWCTETRASQLSDKRARETLRYLIPWALSCATRP